jgi:hypothetical protein
MSDDIRTFIVTQFAMYLTPQQVADAVKAEFGKTMLRSNVNKYNPESMAGRKMANKWKRIHADVRERFHEERTAIPMANRNARLKQLQKHYETALDRNNIPLCTSILEQIAKEVGNVHTNERTVNHKGQIAVQEVMTTEEKRNFITDRLIEAMEKAGVKSNAPSSQTQQ